jgi:hypothetical protein
MTKTYDKLMTRLVTSAKPVQMFENIIGYPGRRIVTSISALMVFQG